MNQLTLCYQTRKLNNIKQIQDNFIVLKVKLRLPICEIWCEFF